MDEILIPVSQAAGLFPKKPSSATLWRWILHGVKGVRLSTLLVGGRRYVTEQMVRDFLAELNNSHHGSLTSKSEEIANKFLDRELGVK